jgi:hypothetical protein
MLSYLNAETGFIRAFANRSLLLIFLCALTRGGDRFGKASALGVSLDLNPGLIVIFGPVLALLLLISLKIEADTLVVAREVVLPKMNHLDPAATKASRWVLPAVRGSLRSRHLHDSAIHPQRRALETGMRGIRLDPKVHGFLDPGRFAIDLLYS